MITPIPRPALLLGLAGVLPFAWGAATVLWPALAAQSPFALDARFVGTDVLQAYGVVILSFMSGVLWGFATRAEGARAALGYTLSVLPALWAFFMTGGTEESALFALMSGFAGLLALDAVFWRQALAPPWWMALRLLLTALVLACLAIGVWG